MKLDIGVRARLQFLCRVVEKEARYLIETDVRLFDHALSPESLAIITRDPLQRAKGWASVCAYIGRDSFQVCQSSSETYRCIS